MRIERTSLYRLDTETYAIEHVETTGESPGWIYGHRADLTANDQLRISGGKIVRSRQEHTPNDGASILDLSTCIWRSAPV